MARHDIILMSLLILPTILFVFFVISELQKLFETKRIINSTLSGFDRMLDARKIQIANIKESYRNAGSDVNLREFIITTTVEKLREMDQNPTQA